MANTQLATKQKTGIAAYLGGEAVRKNVAGVIGEANVTRFVSSVVSAVQANPQLAKCTNASILSAALQGEALQLPPSPQLGMFYMVPYDKREKINGRWETVSSEASFQIGYKGLIQLAIRSGQYKDIVVNEIKEGECAGYNPITEELDLRPIMDPDKREAAKTIGYYAAFKTISGFEKRMYWSRQRMENHARHYSKSYQYDVKENKKTSIWSTNFDAMAKKTMLRRLLSTWGIMSVEMVQAYENDQAVIDMDDDGLTARHIDNPTTVVEQEVQADIQQNANAVAFDEEIIDEEPVQPVAEPEPPKPKKQSKKKEQAPAEEKPAEPDVFEPYDNPDFDALDPDQMWR